MKKRLLEPESEYFSKSPRIGLGLLFIKEIMDLYNGKIQITDRIQGNFIEGANFQLFIQKVI